MRRPEACEAAPGWGCTCGYHGMTADAFVRTMRKRQSARFAVLGTVSLWGRTIVCERGWRAEYAYPQELFLPADAGWESNLLDSYQESFRVYGVCANIMRFDAVIDRAAKER